MTKESGRVPDGTGLSSTTEPASSLGPSGFDPSRDLWPFMGYAPGNYMGSCRSCERVFHDLDKRAHQCLECAIREAKAALTEARSMKAERNAFRTQAINRGWNWRLCDAYGRDEYQRHMEREVDATLEVMLGRKTLEETLRDSDGSPKGGDGEAGSVRSTTARAAEGGIAQPSPSPHPRDPS